MALPKVLEISEDSITKIGDKINNKSDIEGQAQNLIESTTDKFLDAINPVNIVTAMVTKKFLDKKNKEKEEVTSKLMNDEIDVLKSIDSTLFSIDDRIMRFMSNQEFMAEASIGPQMPGSTGAATINPYLENIGGVKNIADGISDEVIGTAIGSMIGGNILKAVSFVGKKLGLVGLIVGGITAAMSNFDIGESISTNINTNKLSKGITAIMFGIDGELSSVLKTIGTYTAIGAGIGSIVPVVGTLLGGLIGAAVGALATGIGKFVGFERLTEVVDNMVDKYNSIIEVFSGTDTERVAKRLEDVRDTISKDNSDIANLMEIRVELLSQIEKAESLGHKSKIDSMKKELDSVNKDIESRKARVARHREKSEQLQKTLEEADQGFFKDMQDVWEYVSNLPTRMYESIFSIPEFIESTIEFDNTIVADSFSIYTGQIKEKIFGIFSGLQKDVLSSIDSIMDNFDYDLGPIKKSVTEFPSKIISFFLDIVENLMGSVDKLFDQAVSSVMEKFGIDEDSFLYKLIGKDIGRNVSNSEKIVTTNNFEKIGKELIQLENVSSTRSVNSTISSDIEKIASQKINDNYTSEQLIKNLGGFMVVEKQPLYIGDRNVVQSNNIEKISNIISESNEPFVEAARIAEFTQSEIQREIIKESGTNPMSSSVVQQINNSSNNTTVSNVPLSPPVPNDITMMEIMYGRR